MTDDAIAALLHAFVKALRNPSGSVAAISLVVTHARANGDHAAQLFAGGSIEGVAVCIATAHRDFHERFGVCPMVIDEPACGALQQACMATGGFKDANQQS
jgi:hypothetical protein